MPTFPSTLSAAEVNEVVPSAFWKATCSCSSVLRDPPELVDEVHVPRRAAELAVGGRLETELLLQGHGLADGRVLRGAQPLRVEDAVGEVLAGAHQRGRAQEAADVVGAERWALACGHAHESSRGPRARR